MQSVWRSLRGVTHCRDSNITSFRSSTVYLSNFIQQSAGCSNDCKLQLLNKHPSWNFSTLGNTLHMRRELTPSPNMSFSSVMLRGNSTFRDITTTGHYGESFGQDISAASPDSDQTQRIKFKRLSKTAKHIMNILDKEAVEKVQADREFPDIRPGYIIQLKVEVPENKRRVSILKGIVIARRNAGLHTTFRLRRLVAGVGVESVFPLYSPNIKEMKVLDKKKVRRAKLYYLRDRMNPLKK